MLLPEHSFRKPSSLDECLESLAAVSGQGPGETRIVAGGTDVVFNMRLKLFQPAQVISLRGLKELQAIEELPDGALRIGAGCRLTDLGDDARIQSRYPALKQAIDAVASVHIRNIGTLGGNICLETRCWYTNNSEDWRNGRDGCFKTDCEHCHVIPSSHVCHAINNADTPLALIALNAVLTLQRSGASRDVPIARFYNSDGMQHTALQPGEILTHITIPPCEDRTCFIKFTPRRGMDFSLGAVAARAGGTGENANNVTIVLGSISSSPIVLDEPARLVEQWGLSDEAIERALEPMRAELGELTNLYARAAYKKQIARTLVKRALVQLRELG